MTIIATTGSRTIVSSKGSAGRGPDRTARHVCRARDDAGTATPTSEAFLPAEDAAAVDDNVFDFVDDALVADLTPEEFEMLSNDMAAAQLDAVDDGEPTEVISVAVGGPGAVTPNPTETGFRTQLGPGDELTLNIAPDLPGNILAVHSVFDLNEDDDSAVGLRYALSFYMLPPGQMLPEDNVTGTEAGFMEAHGLQKLGEVDLGRFEAHFDEKSGETVVTDDSPPGRSAPGDRQPRP
jgi:hypothetical protein